MPELVGQRSRLETIPYNSDPLSDMVAVIVVGSMRYSKVPRNLSAVFSPSAGTVPTSGCGESFRKYLFSHFLILVLLTKFQCTFIFETKSY